MSKKVLVREDEPDLAELVVELLEDAGYEVLVVTEVSELLSAAARCSPCVALVDGSSPSEFDLWSLGPKLRALGVPPIIFTAHASAQQEYERDPRGYVGIISKPFEAEEFIAVVDNICWEEHHAEAS